MCRAEISWAKGDMVRYEGTGAKSKAVFALMVTGRREGCPANRGQRAAREPP